MIAVREGDAFVEYEGTWDRSLGVFRVGGLGSLLDWDCEDI